MILNQVTINPKVNDDFLQWLINQYTNDKIGKVKPTRGKIYSYVGMKLNYSEKGK